MSDVFKYIVGIVVLMSLFLIFWYTANGERLPFYLPIPLLMLPILVFWETNRPPVKPTIVPPPQQVGTNTKPRIEEPVIEQKIKCELASPTRHYLKSLELGPLSGPEEIKQAWKGLAKKYHPDLNPQGEQQFLKIKEAYEALSRNFL
jgi:hypothetical protein